jgi:hypothetical protein
LQESFIIGAAVPRSSGLWLGLLGCLVAAPHATRAQGTAGINGRLLDRASRQPLEGAAINVLGTPVNLRSSPTGEFTRAGLKAGTYVMQVRALGYSPGSWVIELAERETLVVVIEMDAMAIDLPGVTIEAPSLQRGMAGFALRRAAGRGVYVTEEDIKRANAARLSDLLRNVSGIRLFCRFNGCRVRMARNDCQPDFFVDGLSANNSTTLEMPVVGITGIEIYRTITETPVDFLRGTNTCGTIAIWTKSGP